MTTNRNRPDFIVNADDLPHALGRITRTNEPLALAGSFSAVGGLRGMRIEHLILAPGHKTSSPHAHSTREEFVFVLGGHPDVWIDGVLHPLRPGDAVVLAAGTGIAHAVMNNSEEDASLLSIATMPADDVCTYATGE